MAGKRGAQGKPVSLHGPLGISRCQRNRSGSTCSGGGFARGEGFSGGRQSDQPENFGRHAQAVGNEAGPRGRRRTGFTGVACREGSLDGFQFVERIRERPELSTATIMMLTSAGHRGDAVRCKAVGISAYLLKPIRQSAQELVTVGSAKNRDPRS